jgi:erythrin-vacuolar iron transport family protein
LNPKRSLDFGTMSLMDALDLAILVEEEAQERYLEFVDQLELHHTREAAEFFRFMAQNEARHAEELSKRRRAVFGDKPRRVTREMLWDVEAPDYDQARTSMSTRSAVMAALASEVKAHAFFVAAIPHVKDPDVLTLFEELRDEELYHRDLVRQQLGKLGPEADEAWDTSDEPTAQ